MFQRETVVLDRFLNAPKVLQEITQARVGIGVRGVDLEHPSKGLLGIPQQAFPQQNRAVVVVRFRSIRIQAHRRVVVLLRTFGLSLRPYKEIRFT